MLIGPRRSRCRTVWRQGVMLRSLRKYFDFSIVDSFGVAWIDDITLRATSIVGSTDRS